MRFSSPLIASALLSSALLLSACSVEVDTDFSSEESGEEKTALSEIAQALESADIATIRAKYEAGEWTSEQVVRAYLERIDSFNGDINAIISLNPDALDVARALDAERKEGNIRGGLHGIPVLVKDNIETADNMPTTAGSLALKDNFAGRDAPLIANLRAEGAIILGKTNLSEWANFRDYDSISGWSAIGGQTRNPHYLDRSPCGSSSGSGAAMAASFAAATIGTETDGSIICPANANGVVGFKPTLGLISRTYIVPIAITQDTAGPITKTVMDAAMMASAMAGSDENDPATHHADARKSDLTSGLKPDALSGMRIGALHVAAGDDPRVMALFEENLEVLEKAGAVIVNIEDYEQSPTLWADEFEVLKYEFNASLNDYLASTPANISVRSMEDLIAFNDETPRELALFDQRILRDSVAMAGLDDPDYLEILARLKKAAREDGIDKMLEEYEVDILVSPSMMPAFLIEPVYGDQFIGGTGWTGMAAIAGYPHLAVPMGDIRGLPIGLSFIGGKWQDAKVLQAGYAYEQASQKRMTPGFVTSTHEVPEIKAAQEKF
jgi:amidase